MYQIKRLSFCLIIAGLMLSIPIMGATQTQSKPADSLKTNMTQSDSLSFLDNYEDILDGEIELEEINIEAVIEKPMVSILPKRMEPKFDELEFVDRSFERELKSIPQDPMVSDDRLLAPKKIDNLKKAILKKKAKSKKN